MILRKLLRKTVSQLFVSFFSYRKNIKNPAVLPFFSHGSGADCSQLIISMAVLFISNAGNEAENAMIGSDD